jgi:transcriptional regulator with XRE-family HTH domain
MATKLGERLRERRQELGLRVSDLARLLGYRNLSKGSRRIQRLEQSGWDGSELLRRIVEVLRIDPEIALDLIQRDRDDYVAAWDRWADEPVPLTAVVKLIPAVYSSLEIPATVTTTEEAVAWGVETAKRMRKRVYVKPSRRLTYVIDEDGNVQKAKSTPDQYGLPYSCVGRAKFLFNFDGIKQIGPATESEAE